MALGAREDAAQAIEQQHPVGQGRKRVEHAAPGHVGQRSGHADRASACIANGDAAGEDPAVGPVLVQHAVLVLEVRRQALEVIDDLRAHAFGIVRVDAGRDRVGIVRQLVLGESEDRLESG